MYIKLTKTDNSPIWLNAAFIVTVEPNPKNGGSVVVPVGDGLDYDVKESPETVLAMLEGAPVPAVIPVPASDALIKKSGKKDTGVSDLRTTDVAPKAEKTVKKTAGKRTENKADKTTEAKSESDAGKSAGKNNTAAKGRKKKSELDDVQLDRLRRLAPKTMKKLINTVSTQFKVTDAEATVDALNRAGVIGIDDGRITWPE